MKMLNARFVSKLKLAFLPLLLWTPAIHAQGVVERAPAPAKSGTLAYAEGWSRAQSLAAVGAFDSWAQGFVKTAPATYKADFLSQGLALAIQRRVALAELLKTDPEKALASAVPAALIKQLPSEIAAQLETRVSGIGDLSVLIYCPAKGGPSVPPIQRLVHLDGKVYEAYGFSHCMRAACGSLKVGKHQQPAGRWSICELTPKSRIPNPPADWPRSAANSTALLRQTRFCRPKPSLKLLRPGLVPFRLNRPPRC
jgi:hypothetical protein